MKKPNIKHAIKTLQQTTSKHSPAILTTVGILGGISATVMAVQATPKALQLMEEAKQRKIQEQYGSMDEYDEGEIDMEEMRRIHDETTLTPVETVKATWKPYIPSVITGAMSIACLIGANRISSKRSMAMATAYTLSETALKEYQEKVIETIGEKKEQQIQDEIAKDKVAANPPNQHVIINTGKGNTLCYEAGFGHWFYSSIEAIEHARNVINNRLNNEDYISLNELYYELGLPGVEMGDMLGWNRMSDGLIEFKESSQLLSDGIQCFVFSYHVGPRYDYSSAS